MCCLTFVTYYLLGKIKVSKKHKIYVQLLAPMRNNTESEFSKHWKDERKFYIFRTQHNLLAAKNLMATPSYSWIFNSLQRPIHYRINVRLYRCIYIHEQSNVIYDLCCYFGVKLNTNRDFYTRTENNIMDINFIQGLCVI